MYSVSTTRATFSPSPMNKSKPIIFSTTTSSTTSQSSETNIDFTRDVTTTSTTEFPPEFIIDDDETDSVDVAVIILGITTALLLIVVIFFIYRRMFGKEIIPKCLRLRESSKPPTDPDRGYVDPNIVLHSAAGRHQMVRQNKAGGHFNKAMSESPQMTTEPHAYIDVLDQNNQPYRSKDSDKMPNTQTTTDAVYSSIDPPTYSNVADVYHVIES